jgi:hypothetical protein
MTYDPEESLTPGHRPGCQCHSCFDENKRRRELHDAKRKMSPPCRLERELTEGIEPHLPSEIEPPNGKSKKSLRQTLFPWWYS